jgi:hypothetical protein
VLALEASGALFMAQTLRGGRSVRVQGAVKATLEIFRYQRPFGFVAFVDKRQAKRQGGIVEYFHVFSPTHHGTR